MIQIQEEHPLFKSLRRLELEDNWDTDKAFPLYLFPKLQELKLQGWRNLERLDVGSSGVTSPLSRLNILFCPKFVSISQTLLFPFLTELELYQCPKFASIPTFTLFPSLTVLRLGHCPELEWPEEEEEEEEEGIGGGFPSGLKMLQISNCPKLLASHNKWNLHTLTSLGQLDIRDEDGNIVDLEGSMDESEKGGMT
ncbi:hypothetical protein RIF29_00205 [Crotalaria pallida]|uniref:Uncharacterized protein n=1 Tax=Crotalaria pallida TaxID=3830 RepID=A0AAN9IVM3_CROPI